MSLAFVGRIVQSLKGFYNGINPATLTGAIDVVIVKQPDGSYHSSPFHVRFGKLGVLRSREKVVDIEINGEPIDLHMKLGEAGEAFFVQEIESEEETDESLVLLATSPLPSCERMVEGVKELHRQGDGTEGHTVVDLSSAEQDPELCQAYHNYKRSSISSNASSLASSPRSHMVSTTPAIDITGSSGNGVKPRRKVLKKKKQKQQQSSHHHHKSGRSGMRSVSMPEGVTEEAAMFELEESSTSDESGEESLKNLTPVGEGSAWRLSNLHSTSSPDVKVLDIKFEDENQYKGTTSHRRMSSLGNVSYMATPFSDPETSPITSPRVSRPSTPKSDTEVDKQHVEESQTSALMENSATWAWGMFPTNLEAALPQVQQASKGGQEAEVKVISETDPSKEDSDRTAKSSGGFMSIWTKPSPSSSAQSTASTTVTTPAAVSTSAKTESLEGIYLDDLTSMDDPEMARIYLNQPREKEEDTESGRGQSLPQSPNSVEGAIGGPVSFTMSEVRHLGPVALSLCGGLNEPDTLTLDKFMQKVVTFEDLAENPNITLNPDLVVKIHDKFYNWVTAGPMVLSQIVFHKSLPDPAVRDLEKEHMPKKKKVKKGWFSWGRSADALEEEGVVPADTTTSAAAGATTATTAGATTEAEVAEQAAALSSPVESPSSTPPHSNVGSPRKHRPHRSVREETTTSTETDTDHSEKEASSSTTAASPHNKPSSSPQRAKRLTTATTATTEPAAATTTTPLGDDNDEGNSSSTTKGKSPSVVFAVDSHGEPVAPSESLDDDLLEGYHERRHRHSSQESNGGARTKREKFIKSLRLSSEQISKMGLREGHNEMVFSVTTQYQGTTRCVSSVYLWNHDDKIVISDIDGTITKSDVLGQIMPIIGRDWWQSGVAQLFTRIDQNGYKLIYLSARAIGQSRSTKDMLKSIRQGGLVLPDGPLFLNPTSLFSAFHREVIQKNPEEFKISCLRDIACLFPHSPFIAGFGNKLNDVIAYRALDIPKSRIFTINPQGQLRHDLSITFQSSYTGMSDLVDHLFPARDHVDRGAASEYTGVAYWRQPIPTLSDAELALLGCDIKALTAATATTTTTTTTTVTSAAAAAGSALLAGETKIEVQIEAPKQ